MLCWTKLFRNVGNESAGTGKGVGKCYAGNEGGRGLFDFLHAGQDLKTMKGDDLLSNVKLAYEARNRFAWAKSVPDSVFLE